MTEWVIIGLLLVGWVLSFYLGYLIGTTRSWRKSADHIEALETLLADLKAVEHRQVVLVDSSHPHEHSFTTEPQTTDGAWEYRSCYICKAVNARLKVGI